MKTEYVVGFMFSPYGSVVLIRKNRPAWQHGLLNGVGGKVEPGESKEQAMIREFQEETGVTHQDWENGYIFTMEGKDSKVHVFSTVRDPIDSVKTMTDEKIKIYNINDVMNINIDITDNVKWIIQACLSMQRHTFKIKTYE